MRVLLVHHDVEEEPPQLGLLASKVASILGVEVLVSRLSEAPNLVAEGDAVFGLFVFEASHARQLKLLAEGRGAAWMGILPAWLVAGAVVREAALYEARRVLLVSHRSRSLRREQLRRLDEIVGIIEGQGLSVGHLFLGDPVPRFDADLVFPLTVFRGRTWENACSAGRKAGVGVCAPPLIEGFWRGFVGWIVSSIRPCCR